MTMVQAVEAMIVTTNKARSLSDVENKNVVFLLNNIIKADHLDLIENQLSELESIYNNTLDKVSVAYSKKLHAFNERMATWIHKTKENLVKNTTEAPKPTAEDHPFIAMLKHVGVSGSIPANILAQVQCTRWKGGRQFSHPRGGMNWSKLMGQTAAKLKDSKEFHCRIQRQGMVATGIRIVSKDTVHVSVSMDTGYDITVVNSRGTRRVIASRNHKSEANTVALEYAEEHNVVAHTMS